MCFVHEGVHGVCFENAKFRKTLWRFLPSSSRIQPTTSMPKLPASFISPWPPSCWTLTRPLRLSLACPQVVLAREETSPEDVGGMHAAQAIFTSRGGMTSHAAVVARGWGKPCVCGCNALHVDANNKVLQVQDQMGTVTAELKEGDWVSVNGTTGEIVQGTQVLRKPEIAGDLGLFMG